MPRLSPILAVLAALALAPAAHAAGGVRGIPEPMQLPGDASAAGISADRDTWMVGAQPGKGAEQAARGFGAQRVGPGDYVVPRRYARAFAGALRSRGLLVYAQPNAIRETKQAVPRDPVSAQPGNAWRDAVADPNLAPPPVTPTSPLISLLDTRLDETHPEFGGSNTTTLADRALDNLHGTATAAVAAAPVNGVGIVGVWPGARALNIPLPSNALTCSASAQGVQKAIAAGASVINMSYGSASICRAEYNALQRAVSRGIIPVAAAGNEFAQGNPPEFPASLPHVLTVAAVNASLNASSFSNANSAVDLSAPGENIATAVPVGLDEDGARDGYMALDGTSFAAPMVAAAVAWVRQARPELSWDQVAQVVRLSARDLGRKGFDQQTGFGLLNVGNALTRQPPPSDPLEPNDDMTFVNGRSFGTKAPIVFDGSTRKRFTALVDAYEDPVDVYRVRVRPRGRVLAIAKPAFGNPVLIGYRGNARSVGSKRLALSRHSGSRTERITLRNRGRKAKTFYVVLGVQRGAKTLDAGYALTLRRP